MIARGGVRVDRARLHGGVAGDRERLGQALDRISPSAIGLSRQSVLIVRRLAPKARLARAGALDPFVVGVQEDLRRRVETARRGRAGGEGEDLLFEDEGDLEAAIVVDWLSTGGASSAGRWWRAAIDDRTPMARWRRVIFSDPYRLGPALVRLTDRGAAARWLAAFEPAEVAAATLRMLKAHGASAAIEAPEPGRPVAGRTRDTRTGLTQLAAIAPEAFPILRPDISALIAAAAVVARRPAWFNTRAFALAIAAVSAAAERPAKPAGPDRTAAPRPSRARSSLAAPAPPGVARYRASAEDSAAGASRSVDDLPPIPESVKPGPGAERTDPPPEPSASPAAFADPRGVVQSEFGGLFFLLNVFLALGVYGDFTRPDDGLKGLSPFELLVIVGRRWFGAAFDADPMAAMLAQLAGLQPGERPGRLFEAPVWSPPQAWLSPWTAEGISPGTFAWADIPDPRRSPAWRRRRWLDRFTRYLAARLALALGERSGPAARDIVCRQLGRISRDGDRLDVHFPLADHPIALRLAGLDRNPGWIPAAGRQIEFHFT